MKTHNGQPMHYQPDDDEGFGLVGQAELDAACDRFLAARADAAPAAAPRRFNHFGGRRAAGKRTRKPTGETMDEKPTDQQGKLKCPECGMECQGAIGLGIHRSRKHGVNGTARRGKAKAKTKVKAGAAPAATAPPLRVVPFAAAPAAPATPYDIPALLGRICMVRADIIRLTAQYADELAALKAAIGAGS